MFGKRFGDRGIPIGMANRFHLFLFSPVLSCVVCCAVCWSRTSVRHDFSFVEIRADFARLFQFFVLIGGYNFLKQLTIRDLSYLATIS